MKSKTAIATFWSLSDTFTNFVLKFFFAIAITRLLTPRDYGLVAYTSLFIGVATWLSDWGFGTSLIQKKDANNLDFSTGYFFNITISIFFFSLYYSFAPFVSRIFNEPELKDILRVVSLTLILNALCYIHQIKLIKGVDFKGLTVINLLSSILSGIIGLGLAYCGFHYWALIFQSLVGYLFRMLGLWYLVRWMPIFKFSLLSFKEQFNFGLKVFIQGLLDSIFKEIHSLIIGKTYQTEALGNYSRGQRFYNLFVVQTGISVNRVLYPTMVSKNLNHEVHKEMYFKTYRLLFFMMAPLSLFLILFSKQIILVLLTDKWILASPYMQLYCIAGFIFLLTYFNSSSILSNNRSSLFLYIDLFQKALIGIALIITYRMGIRSIIIGWLVAYYIYFIFYEIIMYRLGYYSFSKYKEMILILICLLPMIGFYKLSVIFISNTYILLGTNILILPILYLLLSYLLKIKSLIDMRDILFPILKK
ncbi:MAG TPA: lipopolysaccharide biosynthesis protein [Tenuifilaceae bacterium]|nr:lipopolysaccharide biosynthesis protein [Tenuifilaceae bacterium]HPN22249.1 lipopolysaccharide biosynthesis protein [Tenuifilaceae bacterium]